MVSEVIKKYAIKQSAIMFPCEKGSAEIVDYHNSDETTEKEKAERLTVIKDKLPKD